MQHGYHLSTDVMQPNFLMFWNVVPMHSECDCAIHFKIIYFMCFIQGSTIVSEFSPGSTYPSLRYCMINRIKRGRIISDIRRRSQGIEGIFSPVFNRCRRQNLARQKKKIRQISPSCVLIIHY